MKLTGCSVVVCRATHQSVSLLQRLQDLGAETVHVPLIEIVPPVDRGDELRLVMARAEHDDWLALTSANAVDAVSWVLDGQPPALRVAVVGRATAERASSIGWTVDAVSPEPTAAGLGAWLPVETGDRVVAPLAEIASSDLADALRSRGIDVEVVTAYRSVTPAVSTEDIRRIVAADTVLVTAPSVIERLSTLTPVADLPPLIAIGPTSAAAVEAHGVPLAGLASEPSVDGLIDAVVRTLRP